VRNVTGPATDSSLDASPSCIVDKGEESRLMGGDDAADGNFGMEGDSYLRRRAWSAVTSQALACVHRQTRRAQRCCPCPEDLRAGRGVDHVTGQAVGGRADRFTWLVCLEEHGCMQARQDGFLARVAGEAGARRVVSVGGAKQVVQPARIAVHIVACAAADESFRVAVKTGVERGPPGGIFDVAGGFGTGRMAQIVGRHICGYAARAMARYAEIAETHGAVRRDRPHGGAEGVMDGVTESAPAGLLDRFAPAVGRFRVGGQIMCAGQGVGDGGMTRAAKIVVRLHEKLAVAVRVRVMTGFTNDFLFVGLSAVSQFQGHARGKGRLGYVYGVALPGEGGILGALAGDVAGEASTRRISVRRMRHARILMAGVAGAAGAGLRSRLPELVGFLGRTVLQVVGGRQNRGLLGMASQAQAALGWCFSQHVVAGMAAVHLVTRQADQAVPRPCLGAHLLDGPLADGFSQGNVDGVMVLQGFG